MVASVILYCAISQLDRSFWVSISTNNYLQQAWDPEQGFHPGHGLGIEVD